MFTERMAFGLYYACPGEENIEFIHLSMKATELMNSNINCPFFLLLFNFLIVHLIKTLMSIKKLVCKDACSIVYQP